MWTGSLDIEVNKTEETYRAFCRDRPDIVGYGKTNKEALGDLMLKYAEKTGKVVSTTKEDSNITKY